CACRELAMLRLLSHAAGMLILCVAAWTARYAGALARIMRRPARCPDRPPRSGPPRAAARRDTHLAPIAPAPSRCSAFGPPRPPPPPPQRRPPRRCLVHRHHAPPTSRGEAPPLRTLRAGYQRAAGRRSALDGRDPARSATDAEAVCAPH